MIYGHLIGRLGANPTSDKTPKGRDFMSFDVASDYYENGKNETQWVRVSCFNDLLFKKINFLKKGSQVFIEGKIKDRAYITKEGTPKSSIEIIANVIDFVTSGKSGETTSSTEEITPSEDFNCGGEIKPKKVETPNPPKAPNLEASNDDDLPF